MMNLRRKRWEGHTARMEAMQNAYKILAQKSERKKLDGIVSWIQVA
jgi:hypothetical protein